MKIPFFHPALLPILFYCLLYEESLAQPNHLWTNAIGGTGNDATEKMTADEYGDLYITGTFSGTVDFDPGPGTANLTGGGMYIAKYTSNGAYLWAINVGNTLNPVYPTGICYDTLNNNVMVAGNFQGTVDFDPGSSATNLTAGGFNDIFIAKYSMYGTFNAAYQLGSPNNSSPETATDITFHMGFIYLTGYISDTADFFPSPSWTYEVVPDSWDMFLAKFDITGNPYWAYCYGSSLIDIGRKVLTDLSGNVYLLGSISAGSIDFDPSMATALLNSNGSDDIVVAKYNSSGLYQWAFNIGSSYNDYAYGMELDTAGNIYITGEFYDQVDFDPGTGVTNLNSNGMFDLFLAKYNNAGIYQWAFNAGSAQNDHGVGLSTDAAGNIYLAATFKNTVDADPSASTATFTSNGDDDMLVAVYDNSGNYQWAFSLGGTGTEAAKDIYVSTPDNIYLGGSFSGTIDFDPGPSTINYGTSGGTDLFLAHYGSIVTGEATVPVNHDLFTVYPNPSGNKITVEINTGEKSVIRLINVLGETLEQRQALEPANTFYLQSYERGTYFIQVETAAGQWTKPVFKL